MLKRRFFAAPGHIFTRGRKCQGRALTVPPATTVLRNFANLREQSHRPNPPGIIQEKYRSNYCRVSHRVVRVSGESSNGPIQGRTQAANLAYLWIFFRGTKPRILH